MLAKLLLNKLSPENNTVHFEDKRCLRNRLNTNECKVCVSLCKSGALSSDEIGIHLNEEQCTGCLLCMAACPNDAFISDFDYSSFLLEVLHKDTAVLFCKKATHNSEHVLIPCIGVLSEPILASLNCLSKNTISINVSTCSECQNVHSLEHLKKNINTLISKIAVLSPNTAEGRCELKIKTITEEWSDPIKDKNTGRRSFFRAMKNSAVQCGNESMKSFQVQDSKNNSITCNNKGPVNISKVLQLALDRLPKQKHNEREILYSYFMAVSTNDQCDCCPSCAGMCPTGALKRKSDADGKILTFLSSACSGCGLCLEFCKKKALTIQKGCNDSPNIASVVSKRIPS